ncbi:hypothetical protein C1633_24335 [Pseudomonas protegens]|nr:hypothetical protein C1633_24335 [Pseudomonas protegens]
MHLTRALGRVQRGVAGQCDASVDKRTTAKARGRGAGAGQSLERALGMHLPGDLAVEFGVIILGLHRALEDANCCGEPPGRINTARKRRPM